MRRYQETMINKVVPVDPDLWGGKPFIEYSTVAKKDITNAEMLSVCNTGAYDLEPPDCRFLFSCQMLPFNMFDRLERSELVRLINKDPTTVTPGIVVSAPGNSCVIPKRYYIVSSRQPELNGRRYTINRPLNYPAGVDNYQWTSADKDTETEIQLFYWLYDRDNTVTGESGSNNLKVDLDTIHNTVDPFMNDLYSRLIPGVPGEDTPGEDEEDQEQVKQACIVNRNLHGWYGIPATGYGVVGSTGGNYFKGTGTFEVSKTNSNLKTIQSVDVRQSGIYFLSCNLFENTSSTQPFSNFIGHEVQAIASSNTFNADVVINITESLYMYNDSGHSHTVYVHYFGVLLPKGACLADHEI